MKRQPDLEVVGSRSVNIIESSQPIINRQHTLILPKVPSLDHEYAPVNTKVSAQDVFPRDLDSSQNALSSMKSNPELKTSKLPLPLSSRENNVLSESVNQGHDSSKRTEDSSSPDTHKTLNRSCVKMRSDNSFEGSTLYRITSLFPRSKTCAFDYRFEPDSLAGGRIIQRLQWNRAALRKLQSTSKGSVDLSGLCSVQQIPRSEVHHPTQFSIRASPNFADYCENSALRVIQANRADCNKSLSCLFRARGLVVPSQPAFGPQVCLQMRKNILFTCFYASCLLNRGTQSLLQSLLAS